LIIEFDQIATIHSQQMGTDRIKKQRIIRIRINAEIAIIQNVRSVAIFNPFDRPHTIIINAFIQNSPHCSNKQSHQNNTQKKNKCIANNKCI